MKKKNGIREAARKLNKRKKCKHCGGKGCSKCMKEKTGMQVSKKELKNMQTKSLRKNTGMQMSKEEFVKRKTGSQMSKAESKRLKNIINK